MEKYFGVCYYPELYPKEKQEAFIREDIENMRRARFNVVRMAEFCWCLMEPREGVYDFDWLEEIVDRLGQNGIYTVLCTPTADRERLTADPAIQTAPLSLQRLFVFLTEAKNGEEARRHD